QLDAMDRCRELARRLLAEGKAYEDEGAIRFRMPDEGTTGWEDAVRGRIEFPNAQLEDIVLVRSDGRPTYNFANPVEDLDEGITHVIRGSDHVSNTPKQLQVIAALRAAGYVQPALLNFLALLGWAPDGETTIMSREELIERFSLERVGASPATLDYAK